MSRDPVRLAEEADLLPGAFIVFDEERARYLRAVMRLREGEELRLFNGRDGEHAAFLRFQGKRGAAAELTEALAPPDTSSPFSLWISPLKPACEAYALQKATELGAGAVLSVICARSRSEGAKAERRRRIAEEAAEQCGRRSVPSVGEALTLREAAQRLPSDALLLWCDEAGSGVPAPRWQEELPPRAQVSGYAALIGPEGGFTEEERALLRSIPQARAVSLGPRVLKAETAAVCALTLCQLYFGDWDGRPRYAAD